jgi:D-3-phosphoglycerate dehydrogenase / 2-oxoglutarate reductase
VVVTPHLGASTREAQEGVAVIVAEQMRDFFQTGAVRGAVNVPAVGAQELKALSPYLGLAERLGRFQAQLVEGAVREVEIEYAGEAAELDAAPITRSFLAGLLRSMSARVNVVNALHIAGERGIAIREAHRRGAAAGEMTPPLRAVVRSVAGEHVTAGALFGPAGEARITEIDGFRIEAVPAGNVLITRSSDVPGVIGRVGTFLGDRGINISRFHLGRRERGGEAMAVIETDAPLGDEDRAQLGALPEMHAVRQIELGE